jgi:hypothetical protein
MTSHHMVLRSVPTLMHKIRVLSKVIAIEIDDKLICLDRQVDNRQISTPGYLITGLVLEKQKFTRTLPVSY